MLNCSLYLITRILIPRDSVGLLLNDFPLARRIRQRCRGHGRRQEDRVRRQPEWQDFTPSHDRRLWSTLGQFNPPKTQAPPFERKNSKSTL